MARSFTGTDKIDCGSPALLDDLAPGPLSFCGWLYVTTAAGGDAIAKTDTSTTRGWGVVINSSRQFAYSERRVTTNRNRVTTALSDATWVFFAITVANSLLSTDIHIYTGEAGGVLAEASYNSGQDGVGAYNTDAADTFCIGNREAANSPFPGRLAEIRIWNSIKTLTEFEHVRYFSALSLAARGCWPILGVSPEPDLSGNANHGTVTGTTVTSHPPVGRYVPYRVKMPHGGPTVSALDVESIASDKNVLRWTDNSAGTYTTTIQRSTTNTTFTDLATVAGGVVTYTDTTPAAGTLYYYRIQSNN